MVLLVGGVVLVGGVLLLLVIGVVSLLFLISLVYSLKALFPYVWVVQLYVGLEVEAGSDTSSRHRWMGSAGLDLVSGL